MKKNLLYSLAAAASLILASCNGDYEDWASPQSYDPETAATAYGLTATAGSDANTVMPVDDDNINLVALSSTSSEVSGYSVKTLLVNGEEIECSVSDGNIVVSADALDNLVQQLYGSRASVARDIQVKSVVSLVLENGDAVAISDTLVTSASIKPAATPAIDNKGYYLLGGFAENGAGWDLTAPIWMQEVSSGVYTATVNTTSTGDNWFKFYEGSHYDASNWDEVNLGQMGCKVNGDNSLSGFIVYQGDKWEVQTPVISGQSTFEVTLDMNNLTYAVTRAEAKYYAVGNIQNSTWSTSDMSAMFYSEGGNVYSYTTKWQGAWDLKFWNGKEFGDWNLAWGAETDGSKDETGKLINSNSQSFAAPTAEYYTLTIDMNSQTYSWTKLDNQSPTEYTSISLIGDFNGWGGDEDLQQQTNAPHNWYARITIPSDGGLKFRANHSWDVNWGATMDLSEHYYGTGVPGGDNISVPAGTYDFYINDITGLFNIVEVE